MSCGQRQYYKDMNYEEVYARMKYLFTPDTAGKSKLDATLLAIYERFEEWHRRNISDKGITPEEFVVQIKPEVENVIGFSLNLF